MLASCPACGQVIEGNQVSEHLLTECEKRADYMECKTTGLAIGKTAFVDWQASSQCMAPPTGHTCCSLCYDPVPDDGWKVHLTRQCPENPRIGMEQ